MRYHLDILSDRYDALLVANGTPPKRALFNLIQRRADRLIALDGGLGFFYRLGVVPDEVLGDLDSVDAAWVAWAKDHGARIHRQPSTTEPDFAKGLKLCRKQGLSRVLVTGCLGNRLDHVFSAAQWVFAVPGLEAHLITDVMAVFPLRGRCTRALTVPPEHAVSWFGFPEASGCSVSGVQWSFRNRTLSMDGFHSLSNRSVDEVIQVSQSAGRSLLMAGICPQSSK
jgi:thiamine pyrophosphokinase